MRFVYGLLGGILATVIGSILYLAFGGGDYLLVLSPKYHELSSMIANCRKAEEQRDQMARRLAELEDSFENLTRRFNEIPAAHAATPAAPGVGSETKPPAEAPINP